MGVSAQPSRTLRLSRPLAFFDLETTGTDVCQDRIVEIAVLKLLPDGTEEILHSLVNPGIEIPSSATEIHGIRDADVQSKPQFAQIADRLVKFLAGSDLAGFNVMRFDLPLLKSELSRAGMDWPGQEVLVVDAHVVYQQKERRDLMAAMKYYCGEEHSEAHSALADARATRRVLEAQVHRYPDLPNTVEGLDSFCKEARPTKFADSGYWFSSKDGVLRFNTSPYRGQPLSQVARADPGFLERMLSTDAPADTKELVRQALADAGR